MPTQITSGLLCWIVIAPIACKFSLSKIGFQSIPSLSDFQTPPDAAPMYIIFDFSFTTSIAVIRPLIPAGPTARGLIPFNF